MTVQRQTAADLSNPVLVDALIVSVSTAMYSPESLERSLELKREITRRLACTKSAPGVNIDRGALYRLWKHAQGQRVPSDELERSSELALAALKGDAK